MADCYEYMKEKLKCGKLCVLYLDGLGYRMYEQGRRIGALSYIPGAFSVEPLLSVEPPVTNPNMATMLTGRAPNEHGIQSRRDKVLKCPTIFVQTNRSAVLLEGDSSIIRTEIRPILHTCREGKGTDYWIYRSVLNEISKGTEFIFAHFHEIDDCAHTFGPDAQETFEKMRELDGYVKEIVDSWEGSVLLISDHGLHRTETGGNHGDGCKEDGIAVWGE